MATEPVSVVGVKDALRVLQDLNKTMRRALTKEFAQMVQPATDEAYRLLPAWDNPPLSGMARNWSPEQARVKRGQSTGEIHGPFGKYGVFRQDIVGSQGEIVHGEGFKSVLPWGTGVRGRNIKAFTNGKRPRKYAHWTKNSTAFGIRMTGRDAVLFDTATGRIGQNLTKKGFGKPSRVMWRAFESKRSAFDHNMQKFALKIIAEANAMLKYNARFKRAVEQ